MLKRSSNAFGVASVLISLSFWFAFLPKSIPGVRFVSWGIGVHMILWGVAFLFALVPVIRGSRWWTVALLLPFLNLLFVILIAVIGEHIASGPG
jgi:hypothetical protein